MLEPQREEFETYKAYEVARITYLRGRKVPKVQLSNEC